MIDIAEIIAEKYGRLPVPPLTAHEERDAEAAEMRNHAWLKAHLAHLFSEAQPELPQVQTKLRPSAKDTIGMVADAVAKGRKGGAATKLVRRGNKPDGRTGKYQPRTFNISIAEIQALYAQHMNTRQIAEKFGCCAGLIFKLMRDAKVERTDAGCVSCGGPTGLSNMALRCPPCKAKMKREANAAARQRKQREAA